MRVNMTFLYHLSRHVYIYHAPYLMPIHMNHINFVPIMCFFCLYCWTSILLELFVKKCFLIITPFECFNQAMTWYFEILDIQHIDNIEIQLNMQIY